MKIRILALSLALALGLCGCAGGQTASSGSSAAGTTAPSSSAPGETAAAPPTPSTQTTKPADGIGDSTPDLPSRTYEYTSSKTETLREIVDALVQLYLTDMMTARDNKSFTVTEYRRLSVELLSAGEFTTTRIQPRQWNARIHYEYHYDGVCHPHAPETEDHWIPGGNAAGYLVENCGYTFRMRVNDPTAAQENSTLFPENRPA